MRRKKKAKVAKRGLEQISLPALGSKRYERELTRSDPLWAHAVEQVGEENKNLLRLVTTAWVSLLGDSPWGLKPIGTIHKFVKNLLYDPFKVIANMDALSHKLQRSIQRTEIGTIKLEPLFDEFRDTPVFKEYHLYYKHRDPRILAYLLSFLNFSKKAVWVNKSLETSAFRAWKSLEKDLERITLPDDTRNIRVIMDTMTSSWTTFSLYPKHGPGSVAQKMPYPGVIAKNDNLRIPDKVYQVYGRPSGLHYHGDIRREMSQEGSGNSRHQVDVCRFSSRLTFVPKSYKAVRSICMEPIAYQYFQQGVLRWLMENMREGVVSRFVNLDDQGYNRYYARLGSNNTILDTIDLSSASDTVSWKLVRAIFPARISLHLAATRTSHVELPGNEVVRVHKFAPMGSATCFPVQTLIYLSISLYAGMLTFGGFSRSDSITKRDVINYLYRLNHVKYRNDEAPRIFGDDIICNKHVTSTVVLLLSELGFSVNTEKSFVGDAGYRESCGGHYTDGDDVTFYMLKTDTFERAMSIEQIGGLIDAINRASEFGYYQVASTLTRHALYTPIKGVKGRGRNPILFVRDDDLETSMAIRVGDDALSNSHLRTRLWVPSIVNDTTCSKYQRDEVRSITVKAIKRRKIPLRQHWYYFLQWWRGRDRKHDSKRMSRGLSDWYESTSCFTPDTVLVGPRWRWTPI